MSAIPNFPVVGFSTAYIVISNTFDLSPWAGNQGAGNVDLTLVLSSGSKQLYPIVPAYLFLTNGGNYWVIVPSSAIPDYSMLPNLTVSVSVVSSQRQAKRVNYQAHQALPMHQARLSHPAHPAHPGHDDCTARAKNGYATNDLQFFNGDAQWM